MKPNFLKAPYGRFSIALLIAFTALVVHSCRKQANPSEAETKAQIAAQHFPVDVAKEWFNAKKPALSSKLKINAQASSVLELLSDFTPVWDSVRTTVDSNYYVVEAPAKYVRKLGFNVDDNGSHIDGRTRLLVMKYKKTGSIRAVLMHIKGDAGVATQNVHYMDVPHHFNGHIFYTTIQGASVCGYIYKNGKVTGARAGKATVGGPKLQVQTAEAPPLEGCTAVTTNFYERTCYWTSSDELIGCGEWHYAYSTVDYYCPPKPGSGTVPPPVECDPTKGGVGVESIKDKLVIQIYDGDDGTGGELPPCEPEKEVVKIKNKVKDTCIRAMVQYYINQNIEFDLKDSMNGLFDTSTDFNITFEDGSLGPTEDGNTDITAVQEVQRSPGRYKPIKLDLKITLNYTLTNASREFIASTILHEALHAYFIYYNNARAFDHEIMVQEYIPWFKAAISKINPNLNDNEKTALAYGGLLETSAFTNSYHTLYENKYRTLYDGHKKGEKGIKCKN